MCDYLVSGDYLKIPKSLVIKDELDTWSKQTQMIILLLSSHFTSQGWKQPVQQHNIAPNGHDAQLTLGNFQKYVCPVSAIWYT